MTLQARGLKLSGSDIQGVGGSSVQRSAGTGQLLQAVNLEVKRKGLWTPRRGQDVFGPSPAGLASISFLAEYDNAFTPASSALVVLRTDNTLSSLTVESPASFNSLGSLVPPESGFPRALESNHNLYLLASGGVKRMESQVTAPVPAGVPAGLDVQADLEYQYPAASFAANPSYAIVGSFPTGTITLSSVVATNTVVVNGITLTATASTQDATHFIVGASDVATATNLVTTIGANATLAAEMTASNAVGTSNIVTVTAKTRGTATSYTLVGSTNITVSGTTAASGAVTVVGAGIGASLQIGADTIYGTGPDTFASSFNAGSSTSTTIAITSPISPATPQVGTVLVNGHTYSYTGWGSNVFSGVTPSPTSEPNNSAVSYSTVATQSATYFVIGSNDSVTASNIAECINAYGSLLGCTAYATGIVVLIVANKPGSAGNSIGLSAGGSYFELSGPTLLGGSSTGTLSGGSDGTALPGNSQLAYRVLFGKRDLNQNLLEGTPSGRAVVISPSYDIGPGLMSRSGSTVTVTQFNHGFIFGEDLSISNSSNDAMLLPGTSVFTVSGVVDANHFTFTSYGFQGVNENIIAVTRTGRNVAVASTIPAGVSDGTYFYQVYRSVSTVSGTSSPSDDLFLDYEAPVPVASAITGVSAAGGILTVSSSINVQPGDVVLLPSGLPHGIPAALYTVLTTSTNTFTVFLPAAAFLFTVVTGVTCTPIAVGCIDITPDTLLGAPLYTNQNQDGPAATNDVPPDSVDLARFRTTIFYAAPLRAASIDVQLLSVDPTVGVQPGDTITIGTGTLTAAVTESSTTGQFQVFATGNVANDLQSTVESIVRTINRSLGLSCTAVVTATQDTIPGGFAITASSTTASAVFVPNAHPTAWSPSQGQTQAPQRDLNLLAYSKIEQPDAVPILSTYEVGLSEATIRRIISLRDGLFILKDDGYFILTGDDSSDFSISPLDLTLTFPAPECAVPLGNTVIALTNQGFVQITNTGVRNLSFPDIDDLVQNLLSPSMLPTLSAVGYGVAYESEHSAIFWLPTSPTDVVPTQALVFNLYTNTWMQRSDVTVASTGAITDSFFQQAILYGATDRLYFALGAQLYQERKSPALPPTQPGGQPVLDYRDFVDQTLATNITILGVPEYRSLALASGTVATLAVGDVLVQGTFPSWNWVNVTAIDYVNGIVTVDRRQPWTVGAANVTAFRGTPRVLTWLPDFLDNPGASYHWREIALLFRRGAFAQAQVGFRTDEDDIDEYQTAEAGEVGIFRAVPGLPSAAADIRISVPRDQQRGNQLTITLNLADGWQPFELQGLSVIGEQVSERVSR